MAVPKLQDDSGEPVIFVDLMQFSRDHSHHFPIC